MTTPILALSEIAEGVASQAALHNTALREFEARTVRVLSKTTTAPPGSPAESDSYIIPVGSPGSWGGSANQIAAFLGGAWSYATPIEGWRVWVNDIDNIYVYDGAAWVPTVGFNSLGNINLNRSGAALATTATAGWPCIPTCAGTPTGVPAATPAGTVPMVFDTTGVKLWIYTGGAWKGVVVA